MAIFEEDTLVDEKFDDITEQDETSKVDALETPNKPVIPDKYVGKSLEDIVTMHQEAEKLIGRQAQEVGEVRKLADELIKQQLVPKQQEPVQQENEYDFFEDPKKAVRQAVDSHPDVLAAKQATLEMKQMRSQEVLNKKHPDMADVVKDSEFIEWVKASPVRLNLYAQADAQYNIEAADELLSTFKQIRSVKSQQTRDDGQQVLKQNLKAVGVDTGNGNGGSSQKIYRRTDLIRLQMTDPKRYAALGDEILEAYSQGRVK
jgi:hypothetical protein